MRDSSARQIPSLNSHLDACYKSERKLSICSFYKFNTCNLKTLSRLSKEKYCINIFKPKFNIKL